MRRFMCIRTVVEHMVAGCTQHFKGTDYEDSWVFYHDALSLLTAKETKEWMRQKDYLKRWILPEEGLNSCTYYAGRPVGNCPELMPMDCSLNKDVDDAVRRHIAITIKLSEDDPRKFSMPTPTLSLRAYQRVWNCPSTKGTDGEVAVGGDPSPARIACQRHRKGIRVCGAHPPRTRESDPRIGEPEWQVFD